MTKNYLVPSELLESHRPALAECVIVVLSNVASQAASGLSTDEIARMIADVTDELVSMVLESIERALETGVRYGMQSAHEAGKAVKQ